MTKNYKAFTLFSSLYLTIDASNKDKIKIKFQLLFQLRSKLLYKILGLYMHSRRPAIHRIILLYKNGNDANWEETYYKISKNFI